MAPSATNGTNGTSFAAPSKIEDRLYINGEWVPSISGKRFDVVNPATTKVVASVYEAGAEDVDKAVAAAKAAFPAWSELSAAVRGSYIAKLSDLISKNLAELSYLDSISMGKPIHNDCKHYLYLLFQFDA